MPEESKVPSLHEIAAMPFPASVEAMRKHYNPEWGRDEPEPQEGKRKFRISVDWTATGSFTEEFEAESEADAREMAQIAAQDEAAFNVDELDVDIRSVKELEQ